MELRLRDSIFTENLWPIIIIIILIPLQKNKQFFDNIICFSNILKFILFKFTSRNCEDIAMSFFVAKIIVSPPSGFKLIPIFLFFSFLFLFSSFDFFFIILCCIYCKLKCFVFVHFAFRSSSNIQVNRRDVPGPVRGY